MKYRFVTEYARYKQVCILNIDGMTDTTKNELCAKINNILNNWERGLITIDETMACINNIFSF